MVELNADRGGDVNDYKGGSQPLAGIYHVVVKDVKQVVSKEKKTPGYELELDVLAGTVPGQEGKSISETFYVSDAAVGRLIALALATGVLKQGQKASDEVLLHTPGCQFIAELEEETFKTKTGGDGKKVRVSYSGIWPIGHPDVAHVATNKGAIELWQKGGNAAGGGNGAAGGGGASGGKADSYDDI